MPLFTLKERTYLDADGKATTDPAKAASLLGIEGDEILAEAAFAAGLTDKEPKATEPKEPKRVYYDSQNRVVPEGDPMAVRMYLNDDPTRPDSPEMKAQAEAEKEAAKAEPGPSSAEALAAAQSEDEDAYSGMTKAELVAMAESRGIKPEGGYKKDDYIAALTAADQA